MKSFIKGPHRLMAVVMLVLAGCVASVTPAAVSRPSLDLAGPRLTLAHNAVRAEVGAPPLAWDALLAGQAQAYANDLARLGTMRHSPTAARTGQGENLWMGTRGAYGIDQMVMGWASEKRQFRPGTFPHVARAGNWADVGHYTQMIWRDTKRVGCGLASNGRFDFLVCRYWPAGNITGGRVP